ncbi:MAG: Gfo/Idh/MocA family oxidoreductase [Sedimentisphaerales bacterium]|nr:Gfo/Idh/MocA family oxidoreductase [Sedimentisphaerales bacterium]
MSDIGVAVVGAGFIGPVHVEALRRAGVKVVGILGVDADETGRAAKQLGLARAYSDYDEVLGDSGVQAVHLATPNRLHYEMTKKALHAGKHVMCEKPLAMNSAESAELVELAARAGAAAGVNYNIRFYPLCIEAAQMVRRGDVGDVFSVCGSYVQDWLFHDTDYNWRVLAEEGGELRAVADIGTHWLDLIHSITGLEVEAVCSDLCTVHPVRRRPLGEVETFKGKDETAQARRESVDISTEDYGCILMRFAGGGRGCLWVSQVTAGRKNCLRYELAGSKCSLSWCSEQPNELWVGHRDKANELLLRDPALVSDSARRYIGCPGGHNEGFADTFKQNFRAFYDYIEAGDFNAAPEFATFADGHREILLCEAILKSHREQRWVELKGDK